MQYIHKYATFYILIPSMYLFKFVFKIFGVALFPICKFSFGKPFYTFDFWLPY